jgi:hypothetical protein
MQFTDPLGHRVPGLGGIWFALRRTVGFEPRRVVDGVSTRSTLPALSYILIEFFNPDGLLACLL